MSKSSLKLSLKIFGTGIFVGYMKWTTSTHRCRLRLKGVDHKEDTYWKSQDRVWINRTCAAHAAIFANVPPPRCARRHNCISGVAASLVRCRVFRVVWYGAIDRKAVCQLHRAERYSYSR